MAICKYVWNLGQRTKKTLKHAHLRETCAYCICYMHDTFTKSPPSKQIAKKMTPFLLLLLLCFSSYRLWCITKNFAIHHMVRANITTCDFLIGKLFFLNANVFNVATSSRFDTQTITHEIAVVWTVATQLMTNYLLDMKVVMRPYSHL